MQQTTNYFTFSLLPIVADMGDFIEPQLFTITYQVHAFWIDKSIVLN